MKVKCIKEFTLSGQLYSEGEKYDISAKDAKDYAEYFKKLSTPKNKQVETEENK